MWFRKPKLPAAKTPQLERGERVLAWAPHGSRTRSWSPTAGSVLPGPATGCGWHEIHKATWAGRRR